MIPPKLKFGDEVRVIAPARSLALPWLTEELKAVANRRFEELGLRLTFASNVMAIDYLSSSSIEKRVKDLHEAFRDKNVKAIITAIGGYNSIEILPYLDYEVIKSNPKIICGYSDITALLSGIYTKSGLVTYYGPHYFDFGELRGFSYTMEYFKKCLFQENNYDLRESSLWSDEKWGKNQNDRHFFKNKGYLSIQEGEAEGVIIGGNISTLQLLRGTEYWPVGEEKYVLFIEDDDEYEIDHLNRNIISLCLNKGFASCVGMVFGRFQIRSDISVKLLEKIIERNKGVIGNIPVIANVDFGHTTPKVTLPLGGTARIVSGKNCQIKIIKH